MLSIRFVSVKMVSRRLAPVKSVAVRSALARFAFVRLILVRFASVRLIPCCTAASAVSFIVLWFDSKSVVPFISFICMDFH